MRECERCGIEFAGIGWCKDCRDVEGADLFIDSAPRIVKDRRGGQSVSNGRQRGALSKEVREALMPEIARLTALGRSSNEIALETGVTSRTVNRARAKARAAA